MGQSFGLLLTEKKTTEPDVRYTKMGFNEKIEHLVGKHKVYAKQTDYLTLGAR